MEQDENIFNGQKEFFKNRRVLLIVPHQDDEINIAGGLLYWLFHNGIETKILYTTHGNYRNKGNVRIGEAINSIRTLGGKETDVYCLGYSDQATKGDMHLYMSDCNWRDRHGRDMTYAGIDEYCFRRYGIHHQQCKKNFIEDIKSFILWYIPDVIFCVDFDSHADHRGTSLAFEHAMGEILRENKVYRPIVLKTFAYPLAYKGKRDFYFGYLKSTAYNPEEKVDYGLQNPYYKWEERVRFAIPAECRQMCVSKNVIYKALKCHRSQNISERADRIINSDQVAWIRRTDNLLYNAKIKCSSGNSTYLNDFLIFDCSNIMNGKMDRFVFDGGIWTPDRQDKEPTIVIEFEEKKSFNRIRLYRNICEFDGIKLIEIKFDNEYSSEFEDKTSDPIWDIILKGICVKKIEIKIRGKVGDKVGFTEIEIFNDTDAPIVWELPLLNGDLVYEETLNVNGKYKFNGKRGFETRVGKTDLAELKMPKKIYIYDRCIFMIDKIYHSVRRKIQKIFGKY